MGSPPDPADVGARQLGQANREVDVGARVIDAPVAAVTAEVAAERDAAEMEPAVEVFRLGDANAEAALEAATAATKLRLDDDGRGEQGEKQPNIEWLIADA